MSTDYQVYDHDKQLIISFPSIEVGDVLEVKWTVRGKNPEHDGKFFTRYTFGDISYPVVLDELRVRLPKDMPFKHRSVVEKIEPVITEADGQRTYHWKALNTPRQPQDENLPSREEVRPAIVCSTFPSWESVGKWKQKLRTDCWECGPETSRVVAEVTRGITDPIEKAKALTYWVRRKVRYVSAGERHDYTPHAPETVLGNRYGDCKDTSQMLAVMMAQAGIHVELATLGVQDDGQIVESVPSPWGTHAILLVTIAGKEHWIDTTASLAGWDFLPHDDRDRLCYVVDRKGGIRLTRTPKLTAQENRIEQLTHVYVGSDGSSRCERTMVSTGLAGYSQRDTYLEVPAGERRRVLSAELQDANSRTRLVSLKLDEAALKEFDSPVTLNTTFEIANQFAGTPDLEGSLSDSKVWGKLLAYNLDYERQAPLQFYAPFISDHRFIIHLPAAYYLDNVPRDRMIKSDWGEFKLTVKTPTRGDSTRQIELDFETRFENSLVQPADFEKFRQFHEEVNKYYRAWLALRPVSELSDAAMLEGVLALAPSDGATATALARLYQQHGRLEDARRVLKRACYYNPQEPTLWELAVKTAPDLEGEEQAQRELVKRFPEERKYALALGAIFITQGKQKEALAILEPLTMDDDSAICAQAYYQLARGNYRAEKLKEALKGLDLATRSDAEAVNTVKFLHLRGQVLEELKRPAEAVEAYRRALELNKESSETLEAIVRVELDQGKVQEALPYLRRFVLTVGQNMTDLLKAADFYYRMKRYDDAFDLANRASEIRFHERAQRILGLVYLQRGDYERAAFHLDKAELDPTVGEGLIRACLENGNCHELAKRVDQLTALNLSAPTLKESLGEAALMLKRRAELEKKYAAPPGKAVAWSAAIDAVVIAEKGMRKGAAPAKVQALLKPAFDRGVEFGPALGLRARLELDQGKLRLALADADRAIAVSPIDANGYFVRGRVRQERLADGALAELKKAVELSGQSDPEMLHHLAAALYEDGKLDAALATQRLAVKLRPNDRELAQQLQTFEKKEKVPSSGGNG